MALRSVLNRLPAPLRKRAYGLTAGGAAYKARVMKSRGLVTASKPISPLQTKLAIGAGVVTVGCVAGQTFFGSEEHFYDHRFVTEADPNALAEFESRSLDIKAARFKPSVGVRAVAPEIEDLTTKVKPLCTHPLTSLTAHRSPVTALTGLHRAVRRA